MREGASASKHGSGVPLRPTKGAAIRATILADSHGGIISANASVMDIFGYDPADLVDTSCRALIQLLPRKSSGSGLKLSDRFSKTDVWRDLMNDLLSARVVNGLHKDGNSMPLLVTSSLISSGQISAYSLLFERIPAHAAVLTVDLCGNILSASSNISEVIPNVRPRALCGVPLRRFCLRCVSSDGGVGLPERDDENFLYSSCKNAIGSSSSSSTTSRVTGTALHCEVIFNNDNNAAAESHLVAPIPVIMQVIDCRNEMLVVSICRRDAMSRKKFSSPLTSSESEQLLGYYSVQQESVLGIGQCGKVLLGHHRTSEVAVAIKTLSKKKFREIGMKWSDLELRIMQQLNHENVVQLYDCVVTDDVMYLVMEYVGGGELLSYCLGHGPLTEEEARGFFRDILSGVDYLHRKGIVHRDLKLENCLMDHEKRIRIVDFGLGGFYMTNTLKTSCGSSEYAAPELFACTRYFGPPVDVWAIGVILFAMVCGEFPFNCVQSTLDGDYAVPDKVQLSETLKEMLFDMFEVNPDLRLTVDQIRRNDWVNHGYKKPPLRTPLLIDETDPTNVSDILDFRLDVLAKMEREYGFALEMVIGSLMDLEINQMTACYKMLVRRHPSEIKASDDDPSSHLYADKKKLEEVGRLLQSSYNRKKRGAAIDMILLKRDIQTRSRASDSVCPPPTTSSASSISDPLSPSMSRASPEMRERRLRLIGDDSLVLVRDARGAPSVRSAISVGIAESSSPHPSSTSSPTINSTTSATSTTTSTSPSSSSSASYPVTSSRPSSRAFRSSSIDGGLSSSPPTGAFTSSSSPTSPRTFFPINFGPSSAAALSQSSSSASITSNSSSTIPTSASSPDAIDVPLETSPIPSTRASFLRKKSMPTGRGTSRNDEMLQTKEEEKSSKAMAATSPDTNMTGGVVRALWKQMIARKNN